MLTTCAYRKSRLAQLVERKTLNLVVVGSSPTVGVPLLWRSWQRVGLIILRSRVRSSPGAFPFIKSAETDFGVHFFGMELHQKR